MGFDIPVKLSGDSVIALYHWDKDSNNQSNSPLLTFAFHSLFVDSNNLVRVSAGMSENGNIYIYTTCAVTAAE